jgi:hypothetical protein
MRPQNQYYPASLEVPAGYAPEGVFSFRRRLISHIFNAGGGEPPAQELRLVDVQSLPQVRYDIYMLDWFRDMTRQQRNLTRVALQLVRTFLVSQVRYHPNDIHVIMADEATLLRAEFALRNMAQARGDPEVNNLPDPGSVGYRGIFGIAWDPAQFMPPGPPQGGS